ncbi:hypothetical protein F7R91_39385 [Streptomyces luteolifulvus]|uniref:Uncharacterized protein n=1 Tax=Streptomyces luteolifulvus TaxID=2615112 RepID=A0A6H9UP65_9ACTN|nr:hypothetical protein [Streptomyces luteolifulvus]KAB1139565.1 hypothetical protein F7R91_39385 [Streptomyces luteolifulvus]
MGAFAAAKLMTLVVGWAAAKRTVLLAVVLRPGGLVGSKGAGGKAAAAEREAEAPGLRTLPGSLAGQRVAVMCTGGNADETELRTCLSATTSG